MAKSRIEIRIGTSGWHYEHWKKLFYPEKLAKNKWLEFYSKEFDTVELNNTFYHLPSDKALQSWYSMVPRGFIFAVKASRYITHIKRLKEPQESVENFLEKVKLLKSKVGPILYQLPPSFKKDVERLEEFLKVIPKKSQSVFEFRNSSWYSDDVFELLKRYKINFCIHDMGGTETPKMITGRIIYMRFHGAAGMYQGDYPEKMLKKTAEWIKGQRGKVKGIYVYFNNDSNAYAVKNARQLKELLPSG